MNNNPEKNQGFTLIELLIVIAIIGILMALLFPAVNSAILAARKAQARNDVTQIANAVVGYMTEYGVYPYTNGAGPADVSGDLLGKLMGTNSRSIVFLEVPNAKIPKSSPGKSGYSGGNFVDPWGDPYQIAFDPNYGSSITNAGIKGETVRKSVAIWNISGDEGKKRGKTANNSTRWSVESW